MKFSISSVLHFLHIIMYFPDILRAKFQSITNITTHVFWTFISKILLSPLTFLVPSLVWELEEMISEEEEGRLQTQIVNSFHIGPALYLTFSR